MARQSAPRTPLSRVLLTTGGTGGHIFPALAVAEELRRRNPGVSIGFVGGAYGPEADLAVRAGLDFVALPVRGFFGRGLKAVGAGFRMLNGIAKARRIVKKFDPQVVVGFGGYAAFAAVAGARLAKRPTAIHEQNAVPGVANKVLGKMVKRVFLSLPDASKSFPADKCVFTGNPVRASIIEAGAYERQHPRTRGRNLLVMGGSLGAQAINNLLIELLPALRDADINIWHQTGPRDWERVRAAYAQAGMAEARVEGFIDDVSQAYLWADLVLCRAGATSVAELCVAGKPSVLVPFPHATHNHQVMNARQLEQAGAALMIEQSELPQNDVAALLASLFADSARLSAMSEAAFGLAMPHAAQLLVDELEALGSPAGKFLKETGHAL